MMQKVIFLWAIAAILWWQGLGHTDIFLGALGQYSLWASLIMQLVLSAFQSPIYDGKGGVWNWLALAIDVFINFGGMYTPMSNIEATPSWAATTSILTALNGGQGVDMGVVDNVLVSLLASVVIAVGAELLFRQAGGWDALKRSVRSQQTQGW